MDRLTIWTNTLLNEEALRTLAEATSNHRLVAGVRPVDLFSKGIRDTKILDAEIVFGQPFPADLLASRRVRWIQISGAGYNRYDLPEIKLELQRRKVALTTSSQVFAEPCAQHLMAWLLGDCRQLYPAFVEQMGNRAWSQETLRQQSRLLAGQTILIVGFGSIARRFAELLAPYPVRIIGCRRTPRPDSPIPMVNPGKLLEALRVADDVINILPGNVSTACFFNGARFSQMRKGARYYSIGRGTTTDQDALIGALRSGHLRAAYLDVTDPEPLPPNHLLWSTPNCYITPHNGRGHVNEEIRVVKHFLGNLSRFERGGSLVDRVW